MRRIMPYAAAFVLGLSFVGWLFPAALLLHSGAEAAQGDQAAHVIVSRYFINSPWGWPLLLIPALGEPPGTNLGLADGIPLAALVAKLVAAWLPPGFQPVYVWLALSYVLQPVAAVFALRSAGERRMVPSLAVAVLAISMSFWLSRAVHAALSSHFLILVALGLYFRACAGRSWGVAGAFLLCAALLVHPYMMLMVAAVLAAVPATKLFRGERDWWRSSLPIGLGVAAVAVLSLLLGYGGLQTPDGFGFYSMNLLAPLYPWRSGLVPGFPDKLDATGGQWEGQAYLGVGLLALLALSVMLVRRARMRPQRHGGLLLVCMVLTALALSNRVYLGHVRLLDLPSPGFMTQFRATGRLFWPVAYTLLLASVVMTARVLPWRGAVVALLAASGLQFADASASRQFVRESLGAKPWPFDYAQVSEVFRHSRLLTIRPQFYCGANVFAQPALAQLLVAASDSLTPVDTFYAARRSGPASCADDLAPLQPGEVRVFVAGHETEASAFADCRLLGPFPACASQPSLLSALPPLPEWEPVIRPGLPMAIDAGLPPGILGAGWGDPQPGGRWTVGKRARLSARLAEFAGGKVRIHLSGFALAPVAGGVQEITLRAGDGPVARWSLADAAETTLEAEVALGPGQALGLEMLIGQPVRPVDRGINQDARQLGFFLRSFEVDVVTE